MKTYAYVKSESCFAEPARPPGDYVDNKPISRHGDWVAWTSGKRETLRLTTSGATAYIRTSARAVVRAHRWL